MSFRILLRRAVPRAGTVAVASTLACGIAAAGAAPALAASPTVSLSPTTFTAGQAPSSAPSTTCTGSSSSTPGLCASIAFNQNPGDAVNDITVQLAPGVLANANAASACLATKNVTPNGPCQVGTDTITIAGSSTPEADQVFLVPPPSGVSNAVAGVTTAVLSQFGVTGAVELRNSSTAWPSSTEPNVGLTVVFSNLASSIPANVGTSIQGIALTLNSTVGGTQFLRAPTQCGSITSALVSLDFKGTGNTPAANFQGPNVTIGGCPAPFSPVLSATATASSTANSSGAFPVAIDGTVTQANALSSGTTSSVTLTLPSNVSPNLAEVSNECTAADVTTCPSTAPNSVVGSVLASSAALPSSDALSGPVVLVKPASGVLPGLDAIVTKIGSISLATPIVISGTTAFSGTQLSATLSGLPDVPISTLKLSLNNSLLTTSCQTPSGVLSGVFTDQTGAKVTQSPTVTISGCPSSTGTPTATGSLPGAASGKPSLSFTLTGTKITSFTVKLPRGLSFVKSKKLAKGIAVAGSKVKSAKISRGKLVVTLKTGVTHLKVKLSSKILKESAALAKKIKKHKVKSLVATINAGGKSYKLTLKV